MTFENLKAQLEIKDVTEDVPNDLPELEDVPIDLPELEDVPFSGDTFKELVKFYT